MRQIQIKASTRSIVPLQASAPEEKGPRNDSHPTPRPQPPPSPFLKMTQGETAADKGQGEKLLGVWLLSEKWQATPFASPDARRDGYYEISDFMRLRQSSSSSSSEVASSSRGSERSAAILDGAFRAWLRSAAE